MLTESMKLWTIVGSLCLTLGFVSLALTLSLNGCDARYSAGSVTDEDIAWLTTTPTEEGARSFQWQDESGMSYEGMMYSTAHPFGNEAVGSALLNVYAAEHLVLLEQQGFSLALDRCKFMETTIECESRIYAVFLTLVLFEQETDEGDGVSYAGIRHTSVRGVGESLQLEKMFIGTDPWAYWEQSEYSYGEAIGVDEDEIVWVQSFKPWLRSFLSGLALSPGMSTEFDWLAWLACTAAGTAAGCGAGGIVCAFVAGPYDDCVDHVCTQAAIGSGIQCAVDQLWPDQLW